MQNLPVTFAERLSACGGAAMCALVIFGIASLLHHAISKNDERKRIQGRPIRWWVTGLFLVGAIAGAMLADNKQYFLREIVGGLGGFGLLVGLFIGNVHGGINLLLTPAAQRSSDEETRTLPIGTPMTPTYNDGNPYAPPTQR